MSRRLFVLSLSLLSLSFACQCEDDTFVARGKLIPPVYDFGPVPTGTECNGVMKMDNGGTKDLLLSSISLEGEPAFELTFAPEVVGLGSQGDIEFKYTSGGEIGLRQSTVITFETNAAENSGIISGTITAIPSTEAAPLAEPGCDAETPLGCACERDPSTNANSCQLDFGAVQVDDSGLPLTGAPPNRAGLGAVIQIVNVGTAPLHVALVAIDAANPDFGVTGVRIGNLIQTDFPIELASGRDENCAPVVNGDNVLTIDVTYSPQGLGADADTLVVVTDGVEGDNIRIPLSGLGSDQGLVMTPAIVNFADVTEGQERTTDVNVANLGTSNASVNNSCIDLGGDGTCDGDCTGSAPVLDGALGCEVATLDGGREGKGFVLSPTDAQPGGDDERIISVTFAPVAGNAEIPAGTVLRLETNLSGAASLYEVPVVGGAAGILSYNSDQSCGTSICVPSTGDSADVGTWVGTATLVLENTGDATLNISQFEFADTPATIADDYVLKDDAGSEIDLASPGISLAPGGTVNITVEYANNDASGQDFANLDVHNDGLSSPLRIPLQVTAPN